jgi:hypothetical protein
MKTWKRLVLWTMMAAQMGAWAWFSYYGGKLSDYHFLLFSALMMTGQVGAALECAILRAWGTLGVQLYFFAFTGWGAIVRYRVTNW